jgi:PTH1 family peptidyl-tRNA hydrolase
VKIVAALGNPGPEYADTRHNIGWMAVDELAERRSVSAEEQRCGGLAARCGQLLLFKPLSYMNRSGSPVAKLLAAEGAGPEDMIVLVDDVNLPLGTVRLRASGSSGGHNGLESIEEALGTREYARLRLGVGPCPRQRDLAQFVLDSFEDDEWPAVDHMCDVAVDAVLVWARRGADPAMEMFNRPDAQWDADD